MLMAAAEDLEVTPKRWSGEELRRLQDLRLISRAAELRGGAIFEAGWPRRWTSTELYRLLDLGFFTGQRVELLEGDIIEMAAQKNLHAAGISLSEDALRYAFGPGFWIRVQMSLDLTPYSVPDPDIAVVHGTPRTLPIHQNPTSALLIVEVSETTLQYDRSTKGSLFARVNIADYWILNLVDRQLEVYRNPMADTAAFYGMRYAAPIILGPKDVVSPLALPNASILVADLLP
jgi:Uma2 family endonuclease